MQHWRLEVQPYTQHQGLASHLFRSTLGECGVLEIDGAT